MHLSHKIQYEFNGLSSVHGGLRHDGLIRLSRGSSGGPFYLPIQSGVHHARWIYSRSPATDQ